MVTVLLIDSDACSALIIELLYPRPFKQGKLLLTRIGKIITEECRRVTIK